jgi:hypothetical protein
MAEPNQLLQENEKRGRRAHLRLLLRAARLCAQVGVPAVDEMLSVCWGGVDAPSPDRAGKWISLMGSICFGGHFGDTDTCARSVEVNESGEVHGVGFPVQGCKHVMFGCVFGSAL